MPQGVFDVEQIVWQRQEVFRRHPESLATVLGKFANRFLLSPTIFLVIAGILLVVPRAIFHLLGSRRLQILLRKMVFRAVDVVGAIAGLILCLPFLLVIPILIKLDSPGPVFYKQVRVGIDRRKRDRRVADIGRGEDRRRGDRRTQNLHGKPFHIYKFRTMEVNAERRSGAVWAMPNDPRVTAVGGWLRKYHIDEIPQCWNVLKGEMSLVGPRPERPELIKNILPQIPDYRKRLNVKPGVTGLAQLCMGYDSCLDDVRKKIHLDLVYLSNPTLGLHMRILFWTVAKFFSPASNIDTRSIDPTLKV
jgi:lipopolysaccharide/colanic/teichoic acid biosynthesis glycosyltransferase